MIASNFLDTNVLIYAMDTDPSVSKKRETAISLIESIEFGVSAQVLQEYYTVVTGKLKNRLDSQQAMVHLDLLMMLPVLPVDKGLVTEGIRNSLKYRISYWDGAIIAAAERLKCKILYTEDLNHRQRYGTVEVVNPFL